MSQFQTPPFRRWRLFSLFLFMLLPVTAFGVLAGCGKTEPVRIGFVGTLTGRHADLGTAGRDGVVFAVEEVNQRGGIKGRQVELIVRDDQGNPETAKQAVRELIGRKVAAVVGPMTSTMALAAAPVANGTPVVMVSPTVSSNDLTGKDDNFLRVYPPSRSTARHLALHARRELGLGRVAVVYDIANRAHTEGWYCCFREEFEKLGGKVATAISYDSTRPVGFLALSRQVMESRPDGVFLLSGGLDTAMFCQQLRKIGAGVRVLASEWSATDELILHGGAAVRGIRFIQNFDSHDGSPRFTGFREAYRSRFNADPEFGAVYAYDAAQAVFRGMATAGTSGTLKETIIALGRFTGVQGEFTVDRYGDAERTPFPMTVDDGIFKRVE